MSMVEPAEILEIRRVGPAAPLIVRRRYLAVVPRLLPAAPLVVRSGHFPGRCLVY
jgi:hypothetical protein